MPSKSLAELNDEFARIYANSDPIRGLAELDAAVHAAGLDYPQVTSEWLRSLKRDWVYLRDPEPFEDERANRAYRRELEVRT